MATMLPRARVRHPRRRHRPGLPAPRERAGPVARGRATASRGYWLHNAWVTMGGEKMSKSLGNTLLDRGAAAAGARRRAALLPGRRRTTARRSSTPTRRWTRPWPPTGASRRSCSGCGSGSGTPEPGALLPEFAAAMDDDLGTPGALAACTAPSATATPPSTPATATPPCELAGAVRAMTGVLGLDPLDPQLGRPARRTTRPRRARHRGRDLLAQRQEARAARDFAAADGIRDRSPPPAWPSRTRRTVPPGH